MQLRERWFYWGRVAPAGESRAELRYRAHKRKLSCDRRGLGKPSLRRRKERRHSYRRSTGLLWVRRPSRPIQPVQAFQDYGWVSGEPPPCRRSRGFNREHRLYWGAYGGVWRSQNAATGSHGNASAVTWTSLTDNQATLAVGSAGSYRVIVTATEGSGGTALSKALGFNSLPSS